MKSNPTTLLDKYPGVILTIVIVTIIGGFIILAKPFNAPPSISQSNHASPPNTQPATLQGKVSVGCDTTLPECQPDIILSGHDIAVATVDDPNSVVGRSSIKADGSYQMQLPAGIYTLQTIPSSQTKVTSFSVTAGQTKYLDITIQ